MKIRILGIIAIGLLCACGESDKDEIYNENNTNVVDGIVYDINEKPINGIYKIYYPNGNVKMEVRSKSGKPEGEGRFYNEDGSLLFSGTFKNGLMNGKMLNFYPDGSIREENYYVDGIKDGTYKTYDEDGEVSVEVEFTKGQAVSGYIVINGNKVDMDASDLQELSKEE
ncbi:MAG: hypothetical protein MR350_03565 [Alphaproteobacteria bacterium]|nr:hypothetical protein [Alphaproteobacteria bacterium]